MAATGRVEESPLAHLQVCRALTDFEGQEDGDLPFRRGEKIIIIEPSVSLFWYKAKNMRGEEGVVPSTFLEVVSEGRDSYKAETEESEGYLTMDSVTEDNSKYPVFVEMKRAREKERKRRLPPGTLVIGTCQFAGERQEDLAFKVYEEMSLLYPTEDICWYYAQKTDYPEEKGTIPITHVRLVYISDDDDDADIVYNVQANPTHDRLYDDVNDFTSQSGWFSHPGLPHGRIALQHVLARKADLSYDEFVSMEQAIYMFDYRHREKVYIGFANTLSADICKHFENFGKRGEDIKNIDDELCHHTDSSEWKVRVWIPQSNDMEYECAKKIIEYNTLNSKETQNGLTEKLCFTNMESFDRLWGWFSPD